MMNVKKNEKPFVSAIIVAAGSSTRMGRDKITADLCGQPVIVRTVRAFCSAECVSEIIVVTSADRLGRLSAMCAEYGLSKVRRVVVGGQSRMESVMRGLDAVSRKCTLAAIHDGARPLITTELIGQTVLLAQKAGAAAPGVPVKDTVKKICGGVIECTIDRQSLTAVQTPQVFDADLIKGAIADAARHKIECTDDCMAVERIGFRVCVCRGEYENIKLTTPEDFLIAEQILKRRGDAD